MAKRNADSNGIHNSPTGGGKRQKLEEKQHKTIDLNLPSISDGLETGTLYNVAGMAFSPSASPEYKKERFDLNLLPSSAEGVDLGMTPAQLSPNIMFSPISGDGKRRQLEEMEHKVFDLNLPSSVEGLEDFMTPVQFPITGWLYHSGMTFSPRISGYSSSSTGDSSSSTGDSSSSTGDSSSSTGDSSSSTGDSSSSTGDSSSSTGDSSSSGYSLTSPSPTPPTHSPSQSYSSTSSDYRRTAPGYSLTSRRIQCKRRLFTDCTGNSPQSD